jgi:hypothetical protein
VRRDNKDVSWSKRTFIMVLISRMSELGVVWSEGCVRWDSYSLRVGADAFCLAIWA